MGRRERAGPARARTCARRARHWRLAAAAHREVGWRLDVIPLLLREGIDAAHHGSASETGRKRGCRQTKSKPFTLRLGPTSQEGGWTHIFFPFPFFPLDSRLFFPTAMVSCGTARTAPRSGWLAVDSLGVEWADADLAASDGDNTIT